MLRNKLIAAGVGIVMAIALACLGAALDGFAPRGSALGFACRTVPMVLAIPLVLVAFNFLCDRWERHDGEATDRARAGHTYATVRQCGAALWRERRSDRPCDTERKFSSSLQRRNFLGPWIAIHPILARHVQTNATRGRPLRTRARQTPGQGRREAVAGIRHRI